MVDPSKGRVSCKPGMLSAQYSVLRALILRDIRTRFFGNGLGYLVAIGWPLVHIVIILAVYIAAGRSSPTGGSVLVFLAVSVVPVINYTYMSRLIPYSVVMNKPLLNLPPVKMLDILFSRAILEAAAALVTVLVVFAIIYSFGYELDPNDTPQLVYAFISNLLLALGVGCLLGIIAFRVPGLILAISLFNMVLYATSGIAYMVNTLPEPIQYVLSFNPVLHSVEWFRESYYTNYISTILDRKYLIGVGAFSFFLALLLERVFRRFLTAV